MREKLATMYDHVDKYPKEICSILMEYHQKKSQYDDLTPEESEELELAYATKISIESEKLEERNKLILRYKTLRNHKDDRYSALIELSIYKNNSNNSHTIQASDNTIMGITNKR